MTTESKPEFKREHRYFVFKAKDVAALEDSARSTLNQIGNAIDDYREAHAKRELQCVVVESDWPEYEIVWRMIEARCTGQPIVHGFPEADPEAKAIGWTLDYAFIEKINEAAENLGCESSMEITECVLRAALPFIGQPAAPDGGSESLVADLAMLARRLSHKLRSLEPDNTTANQAIDFLKRWHLEKTPLRFSAGKDVEAQCTWSQEDDVHMPDTWDGSCGVKWSFIDGGPIENDMHFCPQCGCKVALAAASKVDA